MVSRSDDRQKLTAMPLPLPVIEKRAVKAAVKASKKRHHLVTEDELLSLRVQVMPWIWRFLLMLLGSTLLATCWYGWPWESSSIRVLEAIGGVLFFLFGAFGIRKTLSKILDGVDAGNVVEGILELAGEALSGIDF
jgi:hypothetical protein